MSQSIPYLLSAAVLTALREQMEPLGAIVHDNPTSPAALQDGERVVWIEDGDDSPIDRPGQAEGRSFEIGVGIINRSADARAAADADMQLLKPIVLSAVLTAGRALQSTRDIIGLQSPREGKRLHRLEGIDVGGALILTKFSIDYRTPALRG